MKPVQRSYAFEDAAISHGQQWVLKVKYPATGARLPLGLKGMHAIVVLDACGVCCTGVEVCTNLPRKPQDFSGLDVRMQMYLPGR